MRALSFETLACVLAVGAGCVLNETAPRAANDAAVSNPARYNLDDSGKLTRPTGYRSWVYVGTPLTPNELNDGKAAFPEFHNVYVSPQTYQHWKKTGIFQDGSIVIKDLVSVGTKQAASGTGYFEGDFIGLEVSIKSKKHFGSEPGNWAYYSFTTAPGQPLKDTATPFPTGACNMCHEDSAQADFVFTQYYPVLRASRAFGDDNPENRATRGRMAAAGGPTEASMRIADDQ